MTTDLIFPCLSLISTVFAAGFERLNKIIVGTRPDSSSDDDNAEPGQGNEPSKDAASAPAVDSPIRADAIERTASRPPPAPGASVVPSLQI
jgi:hypothetical protein